MNPQKKFHLVFSLLMGAMMIFLMTFVITVVNIGFDLPGFFGPMISGKMALRQRGADEEESIYR